MKKLQDCKDEAAREWNANFDYRALRNGVQVGNIKMMHLDTVNDNASNKFAREVAQASLNKAAENVTWKLIDVCNVAHDCPEGVVTVDKLSITDPSNIVI